MKQSDIYIADKTSFLNSDFQENGISPDNFRLKCWERSPVASSRLPWKVFNSTNSEDSSTTDSEDGCLTESVFFPSNASSIDSLTTPTRPTVSPYDTDESDTVPSLRDCEEFSNSDHFEDEEQDELNYDQHTPRKNDQVSFLYEKENIWVQVTLTSNGLKRYGGTYFNYITTEGKTGGVNLVPGSAWTHLHRSNAGCDISLENERLDDPLNEAFATPDASRPLVLPFPLDKTPTNEGMSNPLNMKFPRVYTYENVLPITSTPEDSIPPLGKQKLSLVRPRGLLPLEFDQESQVQDLSSSSSSRGESRTQGGDERR